MDNLDTRIRSHEEIQALLALVREGDEGAKEQVFLSNVALVRSIVKRFLGHGYDYDDLYQLGCMGLVKAINNYDASYGVRFSTYAVPLIMGEIRRFLRDDGMIRVSRPVKDLYNKCMGIQQALYDKLGREPTMEELAIELHVTVEEIAFCMEAARMPISLTTPVSGEGGRELTLADSIADGDNTMDVVDRVVLKELLSSLPSNERTIIMMRYFMEKTQSEVAKVMGISQVQVSRMEAKIIKKMRAAANTETEKEAMEQRHLERDAVANQ
ncbi:SigB/SigF/SigG family RNA polymerase sigma factor [Eubacteriales bacterium OttesenSCG-928-M02]|nr:SigB/SigF/SigG family RNA polymerase sigma factor [Eubacteriales bacterium OttesenSCG-928-M02]